MPRARSRSSLSASPASSPAWRTSSAASGSPSGGALLGHPQRQRQRHEALLGAVVEVALDAPPLGVRRLDDRASGRRAGRTSAAVTRRVDVRAEQHLRVARVEAAECAQRRDAEQQHGRPERNHARAPPRARRPGRCRSRRHPEPPSTRAAAPGRGYRRSSTTDRDDQGNQAERELQQQEGEVLPGGRVGEPGAQTGPPRRPLGHRPVGIGDDRAGERGDDAPLALGKQAPCVDRADQDRDADQGDRQAHPERDRRHQEDELDGAEHARRDQVRRSARRCAGPAAPSIGVRSQQGQI